MSTEKRGEQRPNDTRARILREASLLFWRHGYRGTSTRQIAEAVGIQQPSLFHFFGSKRAIMEELLSMSLDDTLVEAHRHLEASGSPAERLYRYVYGDLLAIHSGDVALAGAHASDFVHEPGFEHWAEKLGELAGVLREFVRQGVEAGEFLPVDPVIAEAMIAGVTISHINLTASGAGRDPEEAAAQGADFILRGLRGGPAHGQQPGARR